MSKTFLAYFIQKVDNRSRVSLPATFAKHLGEKFIYYPSYKHQGVFECMANERIETLSQHLDSLNPFDLNNEIAITIFGNAQECLIEESGHRIRLDNTLLECKEDGLIAFVGCGATFQIWKPSKFQEFQEYSYQVMLEKIKK